MIRRVAVAVLLVFAGVVVAGFVFGPEQIERGGQGVLPHEEYSLSSAARARHASLTIADWHTDSLLWHRDLTSESDRGHVDFPRLKRGNVAIQMFVAVTKSPRGQNYERNSGGSDNITALAVLQRWPPRTWTSLRERALYQAEKLHAFAAETSGEVVVVRTAAALAQVLEARRTGPDRPVAALLGIEGTHALDGDLESIDVLYDAGFRMIGLQHFFDNLAGGSLHGENGGGLTAFGREVVKRLEAREIIVDLAHSSEAVVRDVLEIAARPVVVSHTGIRSACDSPRNISDELMTEIAERGGLVGVGYWRGAICDVTPDGVAAALRAAIDLVGVDHVALGSDFDGGTFTTFDTGELAAVTDALMRAGFRDAEIEQVMGENSVRFLLEQLPAS